MKRTAVRLLGVCVSVLLAGGGFASCNKRDVPTSGLKTEEVAGNNRMFRRNYKEAGGNRGNGEVGRI